MTPGRLWRRLHELVTQRVLGVDDTPERIAFGVFLGFFVAWTPTLGFQLVLYLAIASVLRANRVVGLPILFITNPLTAVPMYWLAWWVGSLIAHGGPREYPSDAELESKLQQPATTGGEGWSDVFTVDFWEAMGEQLVRLGVELWIGCFALGLLTAVPAYFVTLRAVRAVRRRRGTA